MSRRPATCPPRQRSPASPRRPPLLEFGATACRSLLPSVWAAVAGRPGRASSPHATVMAPRATRKNRVLKCALGGLCALYLALAAVFFAATCSLAPSNSSPPSSSPFPPPRPTAGARHGLSVLRMAARPSSKPQHTLRLASRRTLEYAVPPYRCAVMLIPPVEGYSGIVDWDQQWNQRASTSMLWGLQGD